MNLKENYLRGSRLLGLCVAIFTGLSLQAQVLEGKVVDGETGQGLPGVLVYSGSDTTTTSTTGQFVISPSGDHPIGFRTLGYEVLTLRAEEITNVILLKPKAYAMEGVVVNGFVTGRDFWKVPMPISKLGRRELEDIAPIMVMPALNLLPGVYMQSGAINTNRISIRGIGSRSPFSTNKLRAYFGDIPLTNGSGETTIEDIDMGWLGRMEVVRGPSSTLHGAGLGGAMLLYPDRRAEPSSLEVDFTAGSFGLYRTALKGTYGHEKGSYKIYYSDLHSDGYRDNNEVDRQVMGASFSNYNEKTEDHLLAYYLEQRAFIPSSVNEETFLNNPTAAAPNWQAAEGLETYKRGLIGYSHSRELSENISASLGLFGTWFLNDERRPFNILDEMTVGFGLRPKLEWSINEDIQIVGGLEYFTDWYQWSTFENDFSQSAGPASERGAVLEQNRERRRYSNLFAEVQWQLDRLTLTAGGNFNQTNYRLVNLFSQDSIDLTGNHQYDPIFTPKLGFSYVAREDLLVFGSISQGFSPPALEETLDPDGGLNTSIRPERGTSYEIGARWSRGPWVAEVNGYHMEVKDLLVARRTAEDAFVGVNAGRTRHTGLESVLAFEMPINDVLQVRSRVAYALNRFTFADFVDEEEDFSGNELTGFPSYNFSAQAGLRVWNKGEILFTEQSVGAIPITDANDVYSDPYHLLNMRISWEQTLIDGLLAKVAFGMNNMFDTQYASMLQINAGSFGGNAPRYYYPGLPRNFDIQIRLNYQL
ncbi:MAG: TonB-dependent receptor [Bacteroidota bacterium]